MNAAQLEHELQAAIDARRPYQLEAVTHQLDRRIELIGGPLVVQGTPGLSLLQWTNRADAGIVVFTQDHHTVPISMTGFSLLVDAHTPHPAIHVDYSGTVFPTSPEPWGIFRDLTIKGSFDPFQSSWREGISIVNGQRIVMSNVHINGGILGTEPNYVAGSKGLSFRRNRPAAGLYLDHVEVMHTMDGIYASDYEGIVITRGAMVGTRRGIHIDHTDTFPHVTVLATHCNSFFECIKAVNAQQLLLRDNPLHLRSPELFGAGIRIGGQHRARDSVISGNTLQNYGEKRNVPIGIVVEAMSGGIIAENTFADFEIGLWMTGNTRDVLVPSASFRGCTTPVIDDGVNNRVRETKFAAGG